MLIRSNHICSLIIAPHPVRYSAIPTRPYSKIEHEDTGRMFRQVAFLPDCSGWPRLNSSSICSSPVLRVRLSPRPS